MELENIVMFLLLGDMINSKGSGRTKQFTHIMRPSIFRPDLS